MGWTQGVLARGNTGRQVQSNSRVAVSFCLYGAESRAATELEADGNVKSKAELAIQRCIRKRTRKRGYVSISGFNDQPTRKKSEILAVVDCAIKKATEATKGI